MLYKNLLQKFFQRKNKQEDNKYKRRKLKKLFIRESKNKL